MFVCSYFSFSWRLLSYKLQHVQTQNNQTSGKFSPRWIFIHIKCLLLFSFWKCKYFSGAILFDGYSMGSLNTKCKISYFDFIAHRSTCCCINENFDDHFLHTKQKTPTETKDFLLSWFVWHHNNYIYKMHNSVHSFKK